MLKFIFLFCLSFGAFADEWTAADREREAVYLIVDAMDWAQTRTIAKNPDTYFEHNGMLGQHPTVNQVNKFFAIGMLAHIGVAYALPREFREDFQYITIGLEVFTVFKNRKIGLSIEF